MNEQVFDFSAEMLFEKYKECFFDNFGNPCTDAEAKERFNSCIAKSKNYKRGVYFHVCCNCNEAGAGKGLYLGKDKAALDYFYNFGGTSGCKILTYCGFPKFLDLTDNDDFSAFKKFASENFDKYEDDVMKQATLAKGFDGIRYFDIDATGEEFVLFNTDAVELQPDNLSKKLEGGNK